MPINQFDQIIRETETLHWKERDAEEALKLDYSLYLGRRIRVERTAVGGYETVRFPLGS